MGRRAISKEDKITRRQLLISERGKIYSRRYQNTEDIKSKRTGNQRLRRNIKRKTSPFISQSASISRRPEEGVENLASNRSDIAGNKFEYSS
jgi:hypothetical protein